MKHINMIVLMSLYLASVMSAAMAQESEGKVESKLWVEKENINGKQIRVLKNHKTLDTLIESPAVVDQPTLCEVDVSIDYWQANDKVKMDAYIETPDCAEAHGRYQVSVRTKDEVGKYNTQTYPEVWSRDTADTLKLSHLYSMNGDTDLVKVRIKMAMEGSCVCGVRDSAE